MTALCRVNGSRGRAMALRYLFACLALVGAQVGLVRTAFGHVCSRTTGSSASIVQSRANRVRLSILLRQSPPPAGNSTPPVQSLATMSCTTIAALPSAAAAGSSCTTARTLEPVAVVGVPSSFVPAVPLPPPRTI